MALRTPPTYIEPQRPSLTLVVDRGRKPDRRSAAEEARIEYAALCDEVSLLAFSIQTEVASLHIPSVTAIQLAGRIGVLVSRARAELDYLTGGDAA